ncbi:MAG: WecB/TagA/CpsF family glycosyltransferase [Candidatus Moranbacteria bacterium]|nr:WecB/TagA/CpsF family glycosyltransferase [Candidatus Moranbacteria bacterium]MBP6034218.1 WecB/TagA/CpsF family glycosyltransferase [Candidatus Moranbacteria bacterium]
MHLLGIDIDALRRSELLARCERWLSEAGGFHRIATVNPEFLLLADQDASFRQALTAADLRIADGFGVVLAAWLRGVSLERFPGADIMEALLRIAHAQKISIYLAIRKDGLSSYAEVRAAILRQYSDMKVEGADFESGQSLDSTIQNPKSKIIFCNFGAPEQEIFLESLRTQPGNICIAMGVGGALDYLTGRIARAPRLWRRLGLEWLWRLIQQPRRLGRIWNATAVFLWRVFREKEKTTA